MFSLRHNLKRASSFILLIFSKTLCCSSVYFCMIECKIEKCTHIWNKVSGVKILFQKRYWWARISVTGHNDLSLLMSECNTFLANNLKSRLRYSIINIYFSNLSHTVSWKLRLSWPKFCFFYYFVVNNTPFKFHRARYRKTLSK